MYYIYSLRSEAVPSFRYVGYTTDFKQRLSAHNQGSTPSLL